MPSVKADLFIYSHVVNVSGQCTSASLALSFNLDFSSCDSLVGFYKSSQISRNQVNAWYKNFVEPVIYLNVAISNFN